MNKQCFFVLTNICLFSLSQSVNTSQITAVNKSKHKDLLITINQGAPQVKDTFITETLRAQFVAPKAPPEATEKPPEEPAKEPEKEPAKEPESIIMRNFIKKEKTWPDEVYEKKSTQIKPEHLWNITVFQGKQIFVANLQEHPTLRALKDDVNITIEISDDGQLKFIPVCPCPAAVDVAAKEEAKK